MRGLHISSRKNVKMSDAKVAANQQIGLKVLNRSELEDFIRSPEFEQLPAIPISKHRALSQIKNPRAADSDVLLILAYCGTEIVGYLGTMPDLVVISGKKYRCAALSCIWVKPEFRKRDVSIKLIGKAHDFYHLIIGTDYVPAIFKMYVRSGFFSHEYKLEGVRLYMRMDLHSILPPKKKVFKKIKPVLYVGDQVMNVFLDFRFLISKNRFTPKRLEYVKEVDDEAEKFISTLQDKQLFKRNREELNWIINNPWILTTPSRDDARYYFDSSDKSFEYRCIKLRDDHNELIAFLLLSKRNRVLRIPYCYMKPGAVAEVGNAIAYHIYKWKINTFVTQHPELTSYFLSHNIGQIFWKKSYRLYFLSKELDQLLKGIDYDLQDGDADAAFV